MLFQFCWKSVKIHDGNWVNLSQTWDKPRFLKRLDLDMKHNLFWSFPIDRNCHLSQLSWKIFVVSENIFLNFPSELLSGSYFKIFSPSRAEHSWVASGPVSAANSCLIKIWNVKHYSQSELLRIIISKFSSPPQSKSW